MHQFNPLISFPAAFRRNFHLLAVLGYRPPGYFYSLFPKDILNSLVAKRLGGVLGCYKFFDKLLNAPGRVLPSSTSSIQPAAEKVFKGKQASGSLDVFIGNSPADGGFMYVYHLGDLPIL